MSGGEIEAAVVSGGEIEAAVVWLMLTIGCWFCAQCFDCGDTQ